MVLFSVVINSFVHVIMYSYYFAALFGPAVQRKLEGIKRNITLIQMVIFQCHCSNLDVSLRKKKIFNEIKYEFLFVISLSLFLSVFILYIADSIYHHSDTMCLIFGTRLWNTKTAIRDLCAERFAYLLHVLWFL